MISPRKKYITADVVVTGDINGHLILFSADDKTRMWFEHDKLIITYAINDIFLVILKRAPQNYWNILNRCFLATDRRWRTDECMEKQPALKG